MRSLYDLVTKLSMFNSHAAEIAKAADGLAGGVVQQGLVSVEHGDQAFRFSRTRDQGPGQAELNARFQNFLERCDIPRGGNGGEA